ncbi:putative quinol monooxygenase [Nocardia sp. NPDC051030]|uniref:putative quinol monooxygenase n=1 Tax=Nocardia sp. NPDC051030 TaxID=3155162 RepID=UPI0034347218
MPTIQLSAVIDVRPEHAAEFDAVVTALIASAATEPGCLAYNFWRDPTDPHRFLLFERYADERAFEAHRAIPAVRDFVSALPGWLSADTYVELENTTQFGRIPFACKDQ